MERVLGAQKLTTANFGGLSGAAAALAGFEERIGVFLAANGGNILGRGLGDNNGGGEGGHGEDGAEESGDLHDCRFDFFQVEKVKCVFVGFDCLDG